MNISSLRLSERYIPLIEDHFFPYWSQYRDYIHGGILNCISNDGKTIISDHKFTWSQGRWLWILANLYGLCRTNILHKPDCTFIESWMDDTFLFLKQHSVMENGCCCYELTRSGERVLDKRTQRYDASIYADCFALSGMAAYTGIMKKQEYLPAVDALHDSILTRIESVSYLTEPYPVPDGYQVHGIPMILVNTLHEYIRMKQQFHLSCESDITYVKRKIDFILNRLYDGTYIREFRYREDRSATHMLDRHINPGHALENLWFMSEYLEEYESSEEYLPVLCGIAKDSFALGWDKEYGGLLRFVDRDGGKPTGMCIHTPYEDLLRDTWDMKLWWPHAEVMYLFPYLYSLTGDPELAALYHKCADYALSTFPSKDNGEWTQICKRNGTPDDKVVALPVKDPYHIMRSFIKLIQLDNRQNCCY